MIIMIDTLVINQSQDSENECLLRFFLMDERLLHGTVFYRAMAETIAD